jgi:toxin secretion/phage lysis holin
MNIASIGKYTVAVLGALFSTLFGAWDIALKTLVVFVILDFATGVIQAIVNKNLDSNVSFRGAFKKILLFIPVVIGYQVDILTGQEVFRNLAIWFYLASEALSCLENVIKAGVPVPEKLKQLFVQIKAEQETKESGKM